MRQFKKGDLVRSTNPRYPAYTGKIIEVFYGFVRVLIDQPSAMGPTTLTAPRNLELLTAIPDLNPPIYPANTADALPPDFNIENHIFPPTVSSPPQESLPPESSGPEDSPLKEGE